MPSDPFLKSHAVTMDKTKDRIWLGASVLVLIVGLFMLSFGIYFLVRSTPTDDESRKSKGTGTPLVIFGGMITSISFMSTVIVAAGLKNGFI